jgi:hypothetical protein
MREVAGLRLSQLNPSRADQKGPGPFWSTIDDERQDARGPRWGSPRSLLLNYHILHLTPGAPLQKSAPNTCPVPPDIAVRATPVAKDPRPTHQRFKLICGNNSSAVFTGRCLSRVRFPIHSLEKIPRALETSMTGEHVFVLMQAELGNLRFTCSAKKADRARPPGEYPPFYPIQCFH